MKKLVIKKFGKTTHSFEVEGKNLFDTQMQAQKIGIDNVEHCGLCNSDNLDFRGKVVQEQYQFLTVVCLDCKGTLNCGRRKDDPTFFYLQRNKDNSLAWKAPFYNLSDDSPNMMDQNPKGE